MKKKSFKNDYHKETRLIHGDFYSVHWDYKDQCVIFYIDDIPIMKAGIGEILCSMTKDEIEIHMKEFLTSPWLTKWHEIAKKYYDK